MEPRRHMHEDTINKAISFIMENLENGVRIEEVATHVGLSPRRLQQIFIEITDKAPKAYLDEMRMEKSADLLRFSNMQIGAIADRFNFSSQFHFSRAFRSHFGISPRSFRYSQVSG